MKGYMGPFGTRVHSLKSGTRLQLLTTCGRWMDRRWGWTHKAVSCQICIKLGAA